jgi:hypothetical protein
MKETANHVQAQVTRIYSLMNMLSPRKELVEASQKASKYLLALQRVDEEETLHGGFTGGTVRKYRIIPRKSL